jgi:hypothetical protein
MHRHRDVSRLEGFSDSGLMGPLHGAKGYLAGRAHADLAAREAVTAPARATEAGE